MGGADPDAGQVDSISGAGTGASVSLSKGFVYYTRDPQTGRLISEKRRPTSGRFEVSNALSLIGRLNEDDPQTSRMFTKEQNLAKYLEYVRGEKQRRKDVISAAKKQKRGQLIQAYANAAMLIGGSMWMSRGSGSGGGKEYGAGQSLGIR